MQIAIIDSNRLSCIGLQQILADIIPIASIEMFSSYEELIINEPDRFVHYFVSSAIYFEHAQFFINNPHRSIVLVHGENYPRIAGLLTLNICQDEKNLVKSILQLRSMGHGKMGGGMHAASHAHCHANGTSSTESAFHTKQPEQKDNILSSREIEVAILLSKGLINKEVANKLNISLTTAITHRKNIMQKLNARSLADIIVYVVFNGFIGVEEL